MTTQTQPHRCTCIISAESFHRFVVDERQPRSANIGACWQVQRYQAVDNGSAHLLSTLERAHGLRLSESMACAPPKDILLVGQANRLSRHQPARDRTHRDRPHRFSDCDASASNHVISRHPLFYAKLCRSHRSNAPWAERLLNTSAIFFCGDHV